MAYSSTANLATYANNPELLSDKSPNVKTLIDELQLGSANYTVVTGTSQAATVGSRYIANNGSLVTITLPATSVVGSVITVVGLGAGGWRVAQNASQLIHKSGTATTTGTGGHIDSGNRYDAVAIVCTVADTEWNIISSQGTIGTT
jgi:hypothetical protein